MGAAESFADVIHVHAHTQRRTLAAVVSLGFSAVWCKGGSLCEAVEHVCVCFLFVYKA